MSRRVCAVLSVVLACISVSVAPAAAVPQPAGTINTLLGRTDCGVEDMPTGPVRVARGSVYVGPDCVASMNMAGNRSLVTGTYGGSTADGVPATEAAPSSGLLAVSDAGAVLLWQRGNYGSPDRLRYIAAKNGTYFGIAMTKGDIYTVASIPSDSDAQGAFDHDGNILRVDPRYAMIDVIAVTDGTFYGIAMTAGSEYPIAGGGNLAASGVPATQARLYEVNDLAVDAAGQVVVGDRGTVEVIAATSGTFYGQAMQAGYAYTVAGTTPGYGGDGGPATAAQLGTRLAIAIDPVRGALVIGDPQNSRIRLVPVTDGTYYGQARTAGDIYTIAGTGVYQDIDTLKGPAPECLIIGPTFGSYWCFYPDSPAPADGSPALASEFFAGSIAVDRSGNVIFHNSATYFGGYVVSSYSANGEPLILPSYYGTDSSAVYVLPDVSGSYYGRSRTAGQVTFLENPAPPPDGRLIADTSLEPLDSTVDAAGDRIVVARKNGVVRVWVAAAQSATLFGRSMTAGHAYLIAGAGATRADDAIPASAASVVPISAAVDTNGNLVLTGTYQPGVNPLSACSDPVEVCVPVAAPQSAGVYVVAARTGVYYGRPMIAGYIYRVAGNHTSVDSGDGGPAAVAGFDSIRDVAVDRAGDIVVRASNRVRLIVARTGTAYGQALLAGNIYTLAGGGTDGIDGTPRAATSVALTAPLRLAADRDGNVVLTQDLGFYGGCVAVLAATAGTFYGRAVPAGYLARVDGAGPCSSTSATPAPVSIATDGRGNILFGVVNHYGYSTPRVQLLAGSTGVYYGVAITGGTVATVAGGNQDGFSGDGGPALAAQLAGVWDLAVDGRNTLDIVDGPNYRLRYVVDSR